MTLKNLGIGKSGWVLAVGGEKALRRRLLEMGITPRTVVTVRKAAPMGDPLELLLRGYVLTLRLEEADKITVREIYSESKTPSERPFDVFDSEQPAAERKSYFFSLIFINA